MSKIILIIILILNFLTLGQKKEISIFIRVDDIFMRESEFRPQEIDSFLKIAEKHNAHIMLATIPARLLQETNKNGKMILQLQDYYRRGHQIVQHGYNHRCPFTNSTSWEFYTPDIIGYSEQEKYNLIKEGKHLLEAAIGNPVTTFVGAGNDNDFVLLKDEDNFRKMGFVWLTDQSVKEPYFRNELGYFFSLDDYAWALTDSNYNNKLEEAKESFLTQVKQYSNWGFLFHDHFTRQAYNNGITLRWFDEFLTWLDTLENYSIKYYTPDELYEIKKNNK